MENIPAYINMLSYLFIVLHMLSVPLKTTRGEIIRTLGNLNLMGRALLANFVIIPILGVIIAHFLTYQRRSKPDFFCSVWLRAACFAVCLTDSARLVKT